jgi:hypothetical protein
MDMRLQTESFCLMGREVKRTWSAKDHVNWK